jgi:hypothetical protein
MAYTPKYESYLGSDCTGSEGIGRTLTLVNAPITNVGMIVIVNNTALTYGSTYEISDKVITFNSYIEDLAIIQVHYYLEDGVITYDSVTEEEYITPLSVIEDLEIDLRIPNYPTDTTLEVVDESGTLTTGSKVYLNNSKIIKGSINLVTGTTPSSTTELIEDTDYTVDYTKSEITFTAAGIVKIGVKKVFAEYVYNLFVKSQTVENMIKSTSKFIANQVRQSFASPTQVLREELIGQGAFNRLYHPIKRPVYVRVLTLTDNVLSSDISLKVNSSAGIAVGDYLTIDREVVLVTEVTDGVTLQVQRGLLSSTAMAYSSGLELVNVVVEISNTPLPATATFKPLKFRADWNIDNDTGAIQLLHVNAVDRSDMAQTVYPPHRIQNRVRLSYKYGWTSVPEDVKRLAFLIVASELRNMNILRSHISGIDGFQPMGQAEIFF